MIDVIVFDADETIIDTRPAIRAALREVLDEMRRLTSAADTISLTDLESDEALAFVRMAPESMETVRRYALARSLARVGLESKLDWFTELFFTHRFAATHPFPEVPGVLAALGSSYELGYATNGNTPASLLGLAGVFGFEVYAHVDGVPKKPAAAFFDAVSVGAKVSSGRVIHIGDNWEHDVAGAAAAGMRTVWLNRAGKPRPADSDVVPDAEIRTLTDLPRVLARLHDQSAERSTQPSRGHAGRPGDGNGTSHASQRWCRPFSSEPAILE